MTTTTAKKAVIYTRVASVSSSAPEKLAAHARQEQACRDFADDEDIAVVAVFHESAAGGLTGRPVLDAMLEFLSGQGGPCLVIVEDVSRIARDVRSFRTHYDKIIGAGGTIVTPEFRLTDRDVEAGETAGAL
jgi:DNA invertase Pin-like site-specific DNA recombinase